ncbi:GSCFA domain-containing protein [Neorhizobium sp. Rsf11]|uniref:GSCFA domain-containing protein n=1 Tax=Neorhizobium phenanthreniclasticum TaxID=3157917 RepID=A0ABV0M692_9HYPH
MGYRIAVIGNCQAETLTRFIRALSPNDQVQLFTHSDATDERKRREKEIELAKSEIIFAQPLRSDAFGAFSFNSLKARDNCFFFPPFSFPAFHPDCVYIGLSKALQNTSPVGDYSSSIAVYSYLHGLSVDETVRMFNETVYQKLGFLDIWEPTRAILLANFKELGHDITDLFESWSNRGLFMHTINHPLSFVSGDIAQRLLLNAGIQSRYTNITRFVSDRGADDIVWPVYPEVASKLGIEGELAFKVSDRHVPVEKRPHIIDLQEFVHGSFERLKAIPREALICRSVAKSHDESMDVIGNIITRYRQHGSNSASDHKDINKVQHPYKGLPDPQFWKRAISSIPIPDVDPVVSMDLKISAGDKIATAGSCFAQHIASRLQKKGFFYLVSETAPEGLSETQAKERNYGVFSARYGNVYTTRQLVQLFDRAMGTFVPEDSIWSHPVAGFVDPFRPQIEPAGFPNARSVTESREEHLHAVRRVLREADVFVFTLGLTEAWRSKKDGAVFPLAPGVAGGLFDPTLYEFVNFTAPEVAADLIEFIEKLRGINSRCRVLLTVSPVPLVATYEPRHVLSSTIYSKSVLRVAAEEACSALRDVFYFPSYEIITGNYSKSIYFEDDMRSINQEGVDHVMRLFFKHLTTGSIDEEKNSKAQRINEELLTRISSVDEVVCDEEALDR